MRANDAFLRGRYDAYKGKAPLFRSTSKGIVPTIDDSMSDEWDHEARRAYLDGYNEHENENR